MTQSEIRDAIVKDLPAGRRLIDLSIRRVGTKLFADATHVSTAAATISSCKKMTRVFDS